MTADLLGEKVCTFTAGDLYCTDDYCDNEDHRRRPEEYRPGNWGRIAKVQLRLKRRRAT